MAMSQKDHIVNILKEVHKGGPNPGEDLKAYLERNADAILGYMPEDKKQKKGSGKDSEA